MKKSNGDTYIGEFKEGKEHGKGIPRGNEGGHSGV